MMMMIMDVSCCLVTVELCWLVGDLCSVLYCLGNNSSINFLGLILDGHFLILNGHK